MNEVEKIKRLISNLSEQQRTEIKKFIEDYDSTIERKLQLREQLEKSLGPMSSLRCAICGK